MSSFASCQRWVPHLLFCRVRFVLLVLPWGIFPNELYSRTRIPLNRKLCKNLALSRT